MKFDIITLLGAATITFPFVVCLVKFKHIGSVFRPFALLIIVGFFTELLSYFLATRFGNNLPALNIFSLLESLLLFYQFHYWGFLAGKKKQVFYPLVAIMVAAWTIENFVLSDIFAGNRYYLLSYYFLIGLLAIRQINQDMAAGNSTREEVARLAICTGVLLFFTFGIIRETFIIFASRLSMEVRIKISWILTIANLISNIIYGVAALYIPKQRNWPDIFRKQGRENNG